jgi:hypothetical protein
VTGPVLRGYSSPFRSCAAAKGVLLENQSYWEDLASPTGKAGEGIVRTGRDLDADSFGPPFRFILGARSLKSVMYALGR